MFLKHTDRQKDAFAFIESQAQEGRLPIADSPHGMANMTIGEYPWGFIAV